MWEKGEADPKLVEKSDAWVTLTWFVVGRKEIMQQQHHYCTCTRFIFHWAPSTNHATLFPAPQPAMGYTAGSRHRQSSQSEKQGSIWLFGREKENREAAEESANAVLC